MTTPTPETLDQLRELFVSKNPTPTYTVPNGDAQLACAEYNARWQTFQQCWEMWGKDVERLDFLDSAPKNMRFGWNVNIAPAGNIGVTSVIHLGCEPMSIRQAIDAAISESKQC